MMCLKNSHAIGNIAPPTGAGAFISENIANLLLRETSDDIILEDFDIVNFRDCAAQSELVAEGECNHTRNSPFRAVPSN